KKLHDFLFKELQNLEAAGLYQLGITLTTPQEPRIQTSNKTLLNLASDNYLGWSNDARIKEYVMETVEKWGIGWASSRVVSGTHALHKQVEHEIAEFLKVEECVVFSSAYQANMSIFENLFGEQDFIFCDFSLHPSLVDGVRLCSAKQ